VSNTILIDGVDVVSANRRLQGWEGVVDTPEFRGENPPIPYAHGEPIATQKYRAAKRIVLYIEVRGTDFGDLQTNLEALYALLPVTPATSTDPVDTTCVLTRRIGATDKTATAEYVGGAEPNYLSPRIARLTLRFKLLTGQWA
jgi:hypothetical protein